jgi:hypothetical protein
MSAGSARRCNGTVDAIGHLEERYLWREADVEGRGRAAFEYR